MLVFRYFGVEMKVHILWGVFKRYEHFKSVKISISSEYDFSMYFALYLRIKNANFTGGLWWTVTIFHPILRIFSVENMNLIEG